MKIWKTGEFPMESLQETSQAWARQIFTSRVPTPWWWHLMSQVSPMWGQSKMCKILRRTRGDKESTKRIRNKNYYSGFSSQREISLQWMARSAGFALVRRMRSQILSSRRVNVQVQWVISIWSASGSGSTPSEAERMVSMSRLTAGKLLNASSVNKDSLAKYSQMEQSSPIKWGSLKSRSRSWASQLKSWILTNLTLTTSWSRVWPFRISE